jgi:hypothetical protein
VLCGRGAIEVLLDKISNSIQIITGIVVILGVVLVVVEMRQSKDLARAQLASDSWGMAISRSQAMAGENPAASYSKLCDESSVVTVADALIVESLYFQRIFIITRSIEIERRGGFVDDRWKTIAEGNLRFIFETEHGREWWKGGRHFIHKELGKYGDSLLLTIDPPRCARGANNIISTHSK